MPTVRALHGQLPKDPLGAAGADQMLLNFLAVSGFWHGSSLCQAVQKKTAKQKLAAPPAQKLPSGAGVRLHRAGAPGEAVGTHGDVICVNCPSFM